MVVNNFCILLDTHDHLVQEKEFRLNAFAIKDIHVHVHVNAMARIRPMTLEHPVKSCVLTTRTPP